jgi:hypothetical protein
MYKQNAIFRWKNFSDNMGSDSQGSILLFVHIRPMSNRMDSEQTDPRKALPTPSSGWVSVCPFRRIQIDWLMFAPTVVLWVKLEIVFWE